MFHQSFLRCLASLLCLVLVFSLTSAHNAVATPSAAYTWQIDTLDSANNVGMFTSLALHPSTDKPYISYYNSTAGDLKLAFPMAGGGDCGPSNSWSCNSLAFQNTTNFGLESALDFNSLGQWGIAYINSTTGRNEFRGIPTQGAQELYWAPVENPTNIVTIISSMRYDQSDTAHIAYGLIDVDNQSRTYIKHAKYVGFGGNCGNALWKCETLLEVSGLGFSPYNSLALYGDLPYVFYRNINLRLAMAVNITGNCGPANDWECTEIDPTTPVNGLISTYLDPINNTLGVAYIIDDNLRYAYQVPQGTGNCGGGFFEFRCITLDSVGLADNNQWMATSLGYLNGKPVIAYTDTNDRTSTALKIAYPQTDGNCGPLDLSFRYTWRCSVVDSATGVDLGYYPSLQVDSSARIHISYYDYTNGNLKYALSDPLPLYLPFITR